MSDRFKFRATFSASYYDENGNDKDIKLTICDVAVYSGGEIGFSAQQIETIINALKLPEVEEDTIWQFINDNYATPSYEWFICDNAIIEQCTGLKDKNGNLIYEGDIVKQTQYDFDPAKRLVVVGIIKWHPGHAQFVFEYPDSTGGHNISEMGWGIIEIIGNIHKQAEQKDK